MHTKVLIGLSIALLILVGGGILILTRTFSTMDRERETPKAAVPAIDLDPPAVTETATFGLG